MNNMETVSQAVLRAYHRKYERSNGIYAEPGLTFISCLLDDTLLEVMRKCGKGEICLLIV